MGARGVGSTSIRDQLHVAVTSPAEQIVIVAPKGEVDMATTPLLIERTLPELRRGGHVVIDLSGVTFLASRGVQALLELRSTAAEHGCQLHLVGELQPIVARILGIAGVTCAETHAEDMATRLDTSQA